MSKDKANEKLWGGRFEKSTAKPLEEFGSSIDFDKRLYNEDVAGSQAHAAMLAKQGIITKEDADAIITGLSVIKSQIDAGTFKFRAELEDIHMNIEKTLTDAIGDAGGRLHTARSRNDQVALDTHMYTIKAISDIKSELEKLGETILAKASANIDAVMPGYTHLQRAQPVLFAHHMLAYFEMFMRDIDRMKDCIRRTDVMPLGACALAGTSFPIDPLATADELGFSKVYANSMDAVSDRDYIIEFISAASIVMMHLSRFCEEIILWASTEFSYIELDDSYSTGSSIMPQKKNPDVAELVRGKTGRVYGNLFAILTIMKSLPLAYNKDMQEDKEPLFDTIDTLHACLGMFTGMLSTMKVNKDKMLTATKSDFSTATDAADYLAAKGMPFREAHAVIGRIVHDCIAAHHLLFDLTAEQWKSYSELFDKDILDIIEPIRVAGARTSPGGTSPVLVEKALQAAKTRLQQASL